MTEERKQAEVDTATILNDVRATGCEKDLLIAATSYAQGLIEGKRLAQLELETA